MTKYQALDNKDVYSLHLINSKLWIENEEKLTIFTLSSSVLSTMKKYHKLHDLTTNILFLTVLEHRKFKSKAPAFLVQSWGLTAMLSHGKRAEGILWGLFHKDTNPFHEGSTLMTYKPPKGLGS